MRIKAVVYIVCIALLLVLPATGALSNDDDKTTISEYCSDHGDLGLTHGGCVAFFTANNIVPHDASICSNPVIQVFVGADNHGQCVKNLKKLEDE